MLALEQAGCGRIYQEKEIVDREDRPELAKCLDRLVTGDKFIVWRLDQLGRSPQELLECVSALESAGWLSYQ